MKVSVVVPAYNEEQRIEGVLYPIYNNPIIDEIIVVDDGSTDKTSQVVRKYSVKLITLPQNNGKASAVKKGLSLCKGEIIVLLDADLIGLTANHIVELVMPISFAEAEMTIGVFKGGRVITDMAQKIAPNLSGQRAFNRSLINDILNMDTSGYSMEVALTKLIREKNISTKKIILSNISHVTKEEKLGLIKGTHWRFLMYKDIVKYWLS
ncbi:glycosyltransferase family 2 protein [Alkaliphilus peptidifermentans]|uniref:Glucosyl-3-phosphoglycerate synthase n=1 Tax=Alkaliphilus peptidifermentans DSM 18978 TaxID=1120976 RepID=A0A1G5DD79_9FIRM|nr:glycosyltransferase family 2 protein [Alkaliphilus peptidifermentans]SCY12692.1 Glycosyl transferase family 2 [Alkaliphilus peptidifermentans DSM 18978]